MEASFWIGKADRPVSSFSEGLLRIKLNNWPGKEASRFMMDSGFRSIGFADLQRRLPRGVGQEASS